MPDDAIRRGAGNAVHVCMGVGRVDRVIVVTDRARAAIGNALADEAGTVATAVRTLVLEDFTPRPAEGYPSDMREEIDAPQAHRVVRRRDGAPQ